jgi:hypothetical protein
VELKTTTDIWDTVPLTMEEEMHLVDQTASVERWYSFVKSWDHQAQCYELDPYYAFSF